MGKEQLKAASLSRVTVVKTILWIWNSRMIPHKGPCKVSKQIIVLIKE